MAKVVQTIGRLATLRTLSSITCSWRYQRVNLKRMIASCARNRKACILQSSRRKNKARIQNFWTNLPVWSSIRNNRSRIGFAPTNLDQNQKNPTSPARTPKRVTSKCTSTTTQTPTSAPSRWSSHYWLTTSQRRQPTTRLRLSARWRTIYSFLKSLQTTSRRR